MSGRFRSRFAAVVVVSVLSTLVGGSLTAQAAPIKEFLVTVNPFVVVDDTAVPFTIEVKNLSDNPLGAVELQVPEGFTVTSVAVSGPAPKAWTFSPVAPDRVRVHAVTQTDRLGLNEVTTVFVTAVTRDLNAGSGADIDDIDAVVAWNAIGRQANNFNSGGNEFFQATEPRGETVVYRDGDGLTSDGLDTHEILLVSGTANDCAVNCSGSDKQGGVTVTISVPGCTAGTLVVDAAEVFSGENVAAFFHYLNADPTCLGRPVNVDFFIDKSLGFKPGSLQFFTNYGEAFGVDISAFDPRYVHDGNSLPACKGAVVVNCVASVQGGSAGIHARIIMVLVPTDPVGGFR